MLTLLFEELLDGLNMVGLDLFELVVSARGKTSIDHRAPGRDAALCPVVGCGGLRRREVLRKLLWHHLRVR